jgi:hypothetical protein
MQIGFESSILLNAHLPSLAMLLSAQALASWSSSATNAVYALTQKLTLLLVAIQ